MDNLEGKSCRLQPKTRQASRQKKRGGRRKIKKIINDFNVQIDFNSRRTDVLKCFYTNSDSFINKKDELLATIDAENVDVISITEVLPKNQQRGKIEPVELQIQGFDCFHNIQDKSCHRGVALWVRSKFNAQPVKLLDDLSSTKESVWCEIMLKDSDRLLVGSVYRSPNCTLENNDKINELLVKMTDGKSHVLVTGDFNFPELDWTNELSPKDSEHSASKFMEAVRDSFLTQHVKQPTHYRSEQTPNILDLVFTNEHSMVDSIRHEAPLGKSHHQTLYFDFRCYTKKYNSSEPRYCFDKGDYKRLSELVSAANLVDKITNLPVLEAWSILKSEVMSAVEICVPKVKSQSSSCKNTPRWMNTTVMAKLKKKKQAYKKYLETKEGTDYINYTRARNQAKSSCRAAVKDYERSISCMAKENPKKFFAYAKTKTKTRDGIADLCDGHEIASSNIDKANILNKFFSSVFTNEDLTNVPTCEKKTVNNELSDIKFDKDIVKKKLDNLNMNKSPGPDMFHPRLLCQLSDELSEPLAILLKKSLNSGTLPPDWKEAQVTPLFKKGDKSDPGNYRPVSLTSVVCKVMESIIRDNIIDHLTNNKLLSDCQHGFVSGRSCSTNLLETLNDWTEFLDQGSSVDAIYLDFAKAFDSVPHQRLLNKLEAHGVQGNTLSWVRHFLIGRKQRVSVQGTVSNWTDVLSGVPQGSVLGPVLFVIFINDLPSVLSSSCSMYADDTKVYRKVNNPENRDSLQLDIDNLVNWADNWQLRFNAGKCAVLHLGTKNNIFDYDMKKHHCNDRIALNKSKLEKDLGVHVDTELKFSRHIESQVNKANRILGLIRRSFTYLDAAAMKILFIALVRPHLEFSNSVWSPKFEKDKKLIEGVLRRATKIIPCLKDKQYEDRLEHIGIPSMTYRRVRGDMIETYKYTHRLYQVENKLFVFSNNGTRGHNYKLHKPRCNTSLRQHYFSQRVIDRWNNLPESVTEAPDTNAFKNILDSHLSDYMFSILEPPIKIPSKDQ